MEDERKPNIRFHPIISSIQKIALYETTTRFYLMGSNNTLTRFRVLKIDRTEPRELTVVDDKIEYTQDEIKDLVNMIDTGNRNRAGQRSKNGGGVAKVVSAFGIMGVNVTVIRKERAIRAKDRPARKSRNGNDKRERSEENVRKPTGTSFAWNTMWQRDTFPRLVASFGLVGYYIILVTKRRKVAVVGYHTIYKIEDTSMIYIPNEAVRYFHPDEQRYVKMFQSIDLSSNFYFSYSYDLSHTLQSNMAPPKHIRTDIPREYEGRKEKEEEAAASTAAPSNRATDEDKADDFFNMWTFRKSWQKNGYGEKSIDYAVRSNPHRRFVWNSHLLSCVEKYLHPDWILYVTHGFIGQSNVSIFGRSIYITVIARRSNKYAGTRFLKRGANFDGDVANEVETEQIVHDSAVSSFHAGRFSSFVQMRGSVPGHWSQDMTKMVPKPTISCDLTDPFAETPGAHFNELLKRYGSPIIILNLVKNREKKKHESTLSDELNAAVKYLNQFLPPEHNIQYISFDMARVNKGKEANVMGRLANIANNAVMKTGIFQSQEPYYNDKKFFLSLGSTRKPTKIECAQSEYNIRNNEDDWTMRSDEVDHRSSREFFAQRGTLQTGIIRTNCVDCLDRTNTAQFAIGKCALGYQLCALGVIDSQKLEFDSDCVRMLEELYEDHGDTLALQYGGSQLVHRIKTYRKTAPWTSQGNDIMQTLSRYIRNTFSDQEKQHTMNLFLGLFVPDESKPPIWEMVTDYYLHHKSACRYTRRKTLLTHWWEKNVLKCLPYAFNQVTKTCSEMVQLQDTHEEMIDIFYDYHRPFEISPLADVHAYQLSHSVRDFMPHFTTNVSPFAVRVRPGRRREETGKKCLNMKNPSMTGQSSTSSTASSASSSVDTSSDDDNDDDEINKQINDSQLMSLRDSNEFVSFESLFPSMKEIYGTRLEFPKRADITLYKRFVVIGRNATYNNDNSNIRSKMVQQISFPDVIPAKIELPLVKDVSIGIYEQYVQRAEIGGSEPSSASMDLYEKYAHQQQLLLG